MTISRRALLGASAVAGAAGETVPTVNPWFIGKTCNWTSVVGGKRRYAPYTTVQFDVRDVRAIAHNIADAPWDGAPVHNGLYNIILGNGSDVRLMPEDFERFRRVMKAVRGIEVQL